MTNDAERVSDIVARLRAQKVIRLTRLNAVRAYLDDDSLLHHEAADIIEAQSKALAEARDLVAAGNNLLDCANAIVGASMGDPDADEAFDMFDAARGKWRLHARDTLSALKVDGDK